MEPHLAAFFAALFPPLSGFVFLRAGRQEPLVRFYSMQSIVFGLLVIAGYGILYGLALLLKNRPEVGLPLTAILGALFVCVWLVVWVVQLIAAVNSKEWEIPIAGLITKRLLRRGENS